MYILECADRSYYVGLTERSLDDRLAEHIDGTCEGYTHKRRPVKLVWWEEFGRLTDAIARERQLERIAVAAEHLRHPDAPGLEG